MSRFVIAGLVALVSSVGALDAWPEWGVDGAEPVALKRGGDDDGLLALKRGGDDDGLLA